MDSQPVFKWFSSAAFFTDQPPARGAAFSLNVNKQFEDMSAFRSRAYRFTEVLSARDVHHSEMFFFWHSGIEEGPGLRVRLEYSYL